MYSNSGNCYFQNFKSQKMSLCEEFFHFNLFKPIQFNSVQLKIVCPISRWIRTIETLKPQRTRICFNTKGPKQNAFASCVPEKADRDIHKLDGKQSHTENPLSPPRTEAPYWAPCRVRDLKRSIKNCFFFLQLRGQKREFRIGSFF